jgi:curved DNA-binding protein
VQTPVFNQLVQNNRCQLVPVWKDYYRILQVEPEVDQKALKKAYHKLAVIWHPDRNPNSGVAEERFKSIAEAYAVLSDPVKRQRYDQLGPDNFAAEYGTADIFQGFDLSDLFREFGLPPLKETLFGLLSDDDQSPRPGSEPYQDFFSEFGKKPQMKKRPGKSLPMTMNVAVSLREAVFGAIKFIAFNSGKEVNKVGLTIPPGTRHGQLLKVKNRVPGLARQPGDLLVTINVTPEPNFRLMGQDLITTLDVPSTELASGCRPLVQTLDEKTIKLTVPPGTRPGTILKVAGQGVPGLNGRRGNLLINIVTISAKSSYAKFK